MNHENEADTFLSEWLNQPEYEVLIQLVNEIRQQTVTIQGYTRLMLSNPSSNATRSVQYNERQAGTTDELLRKIERSTDIITQRLNQALKYADYRRNKQQTKL